MHLWAQTWFGTWRYSLSQRLAPFSHREKAVGLFHTLERYQGLLKTLRRSFEKLRGGDKVLKKQPYGDDIDLDALVMAYAEAQSGLEMSEQVFTKRQKVARDLAVMFMVDMSGSTKGWINQAERESLVLLCEVLETLGDRC